MHFQNDEMKRRVYKVTMSYKFAPPPPLSTFLSFLPSLTAAPPIQSSFLPTYLHLGTLFSVRVQRENKHQSMPVPKDPAAGGT